LRLDGGATGRRVPTTILLRLSSSFSGPSYRLGSRIASASAMPPSVIVATDISVRPLAAADAAADGQRTSSDDSDSFYYDPERNPTSFIATEYYWLDRYIWLEEQGYMLRPRYHPDWKPSWIGTDKKWYKCEDRLVIPGRARVLDATRISDDMPIVLKQYLRTVHPHETEIGQLLSSEPLASDPANH